MISGEHRQFIESHSLCVVGYNRKSRPPSLSPTYYWLDGDEIVFSTTKNRGKGRAVARGEDLSVCIVDSNPPFPYLAVYGRARADEASAVDTMMRIGQIMTGSPLSESARPMIEQRAKDEGRITVRVQPYEFVKINPIPRPSSA